MTKRKVYTIGGPQGSYGYMFQQNGWELTNDLPEADLVQFTGGADVSPQLYGEEKHHTTGNDPHRDNVEQDMFFKAQELGIPCAGICRGGQFLNVMNGGRMWQDVNNHGLSGTHEAKMLDGSLVQVSSTHHQMMRPTLEGLVILSADLATLKTNMDGKNAHTYGGRLNQWQDVEAVYYPDTNCLCYQPHPEFRKGECQEIYFKFVEDYLFTEQEVTLDIIDQENVSNIAC